VSERREAPCSRLPLLLYSYSFFFFLPPSFHEFALEIFKELLSSSVERDKWARGWLMH
jgi:hypothetical protein